MNIGPMNIRHLNTGMRRSIHPTLIVCLLFFGAVAAAGELPTATEVAEAPLLGQVVGQVAEQAATRDSADEPDAVGVADAATVLPNAIDGPPGTAESDSQVAPPVDGASDTVDNSATITDSSPSDSTGAAVAPAAANTADPFQDFNLGSFAFNEFADRVLLRRVASAYKAVMPALAARGVHNALENLSQPVVAINQFLQGKLGLAVSDTGRFLLNSTVGVVGLIDVAARLGLPAHSEDFGQTLGVWGVPQGPFLMLPLLGPSSPTTAIGSVVDMMFKPTTWLDATTARYTIAAIGVVDIRAQLLEADGLITGDRYTFIRDAYMQRRAYLQADGVVDDPFLDDAEDE